MAAVDFHALWTVIWSSLLGGVGVTVLFSGVIVGWIRATEASRDGQRSSATLYGLLASTALLLFGAAVILGVTVMLSK